MNNGTANPAQEWIDARELFVGGKGWSDTKRFFDRLSGRAEGVVREAVWDLSRQSAGLCVGFRTNAVKIAARWELLLEQLIRPMMGPIGASGLDLYARDAAGCWRWAGHGGPNGRDNEAVLVGGLDGQMRDYLLYLPLRNGIEKLWVGVPEGAALEPAVPFAGLPIVYYGTSIVHGEGASRPGMCHAAILGRRLERPVINLGFAGAGTMDAPIAELMVELEAAVYLVDCLPNMTEPTVRERAEPFVRTLRASRPDTPIVLVEDRTCGNAWLAQIGRERHRTSRAALRDAYEKLAASGVANLHYVGGDPLLGSDNEGTIDSSHPSDLGYVRYADALAPLLRSLIAG
ncbi:MAG: hypothetical protein GXY33_13405 [Phycisphaerae bacterium]|nr:hypothetical protein [Phycisphaerae bacterium]